MKIAVIYGTRPEAIKLYPVVQQLRGLNHQILLVNTGQHSSLLPDLSDLFDFVDDVNLEILSPGQRLADMTSRAIVKLDPVLREWQPEIVLVQGDTTTGMVGTLSAFYNHIPVAHVEAGLRTGNIYSPFPEEFNRRMISIVSRWNFAATLAAGNNLRSEGVDPASIFITGNSGLDTLRLVKEFYNLKRIKSDEYIVLCTIHRRENLAHLKEIYGAFRDLSERSDVIVKVLLHANPVVIQNARDYFEGSRIHLLKPLNYPEMVKEMLQASVLITDSGGLQEEAPYLGIPVLIVRDTTERPETVDHQCGYLVGTQRSRIVRFANDALDGALRFFRFSPFGDGHSAERIAKIIDGITL